jgi:creatinine amidohydrolase
VEKRANSLGALTWVQVEKTLRGNVRDKAILPLGSLEQHGPHLPLSTDTIIAEYVAGEVSKSCSSAFLMPTLQYGCSDEHLGFTGTVSLDQGTLRGTILNICSGLLTSGFRQVFIVNGHGGNRAVLDSTIVELKRTLPGLQVYSFTTLDIAKQKFDEIRRSERRLVGHADELETSMMLAINPESVDMNAAVREEPLLPQPLSLETEDLAKVSFAWSAKEVSKSGVIGDPLVANLETGKILLDYTIRTISNIINGL